MFKLTIPLAPVTKKNSQQIVRNPKTGRYFLIPSKKFKEYEEQFLDYLGWNLPHDFRTFTEPIQITARFYMPTKRRVDLTNLLEALDDILVQGFVIADDNSSIVVSHDGSRVLYDKDNPRTELEIVRYEDARI